MVNGLVSIPPTDGNANGVGLSISDRLDGGVLREFVPGVENRLAAAVIGAVLTQPLTGDGPNGFNPLVFFGPSGSGKSLLVEELATAWQNLHGKYKTAGRVVCKPAAQFAQDFNIAVDTQDVEQFRKEHRRAGLLILEDITRLAGKEPAQHELRGTIDAIVRSGRRLVVTASLPPGQWPNVMNDLQTRLVAGLTVPLALPGRESREIILARLTMQRGIEMPEAVIAMLAAAIEGPASNLSGALNQLMAGNEDSHKITMSDAREFLSHRSGPRQPELREIATVTARSFSLKVVDLRSRSRARAVVTARGVAMYVARQLTHNSLQQIGHYFGGRDHTTVLHGCRRTEELLHTEPAVQRAVEQVQNKLRAAG
ncbi:MAG: ATP-binding protein [Pirellulales bacterium]|nr:ATP-binding protein [Pirellulales bacterium]